MIDFRVLQEDIHENAVNKGWWDTPPSFAESLCLIHSEVSEALEDFRRGHAVTETWGGETEDTEGYTAFKPCGIPSELADVVIRTMDLCEFYGIDLCSEIERKHKYNKTREYRHGGKKL